MTENGSEESERQLDGLRGLRQGPAPPAWLEGRIVDSLRSQGMLRSRTRPNTRGWLMAMTAASLVSFAAGLVVQSRASRDPFRPSVGRYVLLLTRSEGSASPDSAQETDLVREYAGWAGRERRQGVLIEGEKLNSSSLTLSGPGGREQRSGQDPNLGGYFVISAPDLPAAADVARTCPHLAHGGTIVIRPVDPTP